MPPAARGTLFEKTVPLDPLQKLLIIFIQLNKSFYGGARGGSFFKKRPPWPPEAKILPYIRNDSIFNCLTIFFVAREFLAQGFFFDEDTHNQEDRQHPGRDQGI